jgi:hypothetical protein
MRRVEVCVARVGHWPSFRTAPPTGMRYCMNSASLKFVKKDGSRQLMTARPCDPLASSGATETRFFEQAAERLGVESSGEDCRCRSSRRPPPLPVDYRDLERSSAAVATRVSTRRRGVAVSTIRA